MTSFRSAFKDVCGIFGYIRSTEEDRSISKIYTADRPPRHANIFHGVRQAGSPVPVIAYSSIIPPAPVVAAAGGCGLAPARRRHPRPDLAAAPPWLRSLGANGSGAALAVSAIRWRGKGRSPPRLPEHAELAATEQAQRRARRGGPGEVLRPGRGAAGGSSRHRRAGRLRRLSCSPH